MRVAAADQPVDLALELAERVGRVIEVGSTSHREDQLHGAGQDPGIVVDVGGLARGEEPDGQRGGAAEVEIAVGKQHSFEDPCAHVGVELEADRAELALGVARGLGLCLGARRLGQERLRPPRALMRL